MEFIEYLQLLRRYIWAPILLMIAGALGAALVYYLGPVVIDASGQMLAQPGAAYRVRWAGADVQVVEEAEMWGTLQQLVESQTLAERAAQEAGLPAGRLKNLSFERDKRGNMYRLKGEANTPDAATRYVDAGMKSLSEMWDNTREDRAKTIRSEIQTRLARLTPDRNRIMAEMDRLEAGPPPGPPPEALTALQTELTQVNGTLGTAAVDVDAARDRLGALAALAQREGRARPEQLPNPVLTSLQTRLNDLQDQRRRMLQTRTESHPEVIALDDEIEATRQQLQRAQAQTRAGLTTTALDQQLVLARSDAQAAQARLRELRSRQAGLQARLSELQARSIMYKRLQEQLAPLDDENKSLQANLKTVSNEILRLGTSQDLQVVEAAHVVETNREPTRLAMLVVGSGLAGLILGVLLAFVLHYIQVAGRPKVVAGTPA